jgi:regulator of sirC expression with transglutaminase-like and TPR domain
VIARMLRNLKEIHRTHEDWPRLVAVLERLVILLPQALDELRDRGLAYAEMGRRDEAIADLSDYVQRARQASDRLAIAERLESLRGSTPRLH